MKKLICALLAAVMVLSLAACGGTPQETAPETTLPPATTLPPETTEPPLTAKTVVEQMVQAVEEKTMTGGTVTMAFNFTMIAPGAEGKEDTEITMEMGMEMDMKLSVEPLAMYTDNKVSVKMTGMDTTIETETYLVQEEGQMVTYSHMLMNDSWTKNPMPESQMQDINKKADYSWILTKDDGELTLADGVQTINGREVYVLSCILTGDEMQNTLDSSAGMNDSMSELGISQEDFAALRVPTVYYIDAHTFYPVEAQMTVEGFDTLINKILSSTMGLNPETAGMEVKVGAMTVSMKNMTYDPVEVPSVPQEAYDATASAGTYRLESGEKAIQVVLPAGWIENGAEANMLSVLNSDNTQMATFIVFESVEGIDFVKQIENGDVATLKENKQYTGHGMGEPIGTYQTMWLQGAGMSVYYAWGTAGDAYVYVHVLDTTGQSMEEALTPMLNAISAPRAE